MMRVEGELDPESGEAVTTALQAMVDAGIRSSGHRPHHRLVHEGAFRVEIVHGKPVFRRPDGSTIEEGVRI